MERWNNNSNNKLKEILERLVFQRTLGWFLRKHVSLSPIKSHLFSFHVKLVLRLCLDSELDHFR